ncbi:hypothetical protein [Actinoplanes sp. CA-252034]|uniref:hypothetical protein n=1 Tax=Actinoplanes sp. CA-252034 TaxID=3239906 RepID=UPI003D958C26
MILTRAAVVLSAVALGMAAAAPAQAGRKYRSLDDAELLRVVADVSLAEGAFTHVLLSGPATESARSMVPCDVELPPGRLAFHLVENPDGADQAVVVIDEVTAGSPAAYVRRVEAGRCGAEKRHGKGGGITLVDHDAGIPFTAVVPRGRVVLLVGSGTREALLKDTAAAVTAYDDLARTDRASS